jgi:hypothetical protein
MSSYARSLRGSDSAPSSPTDPSVSRSFGCALGGFFGIGCIRGVRQRVKIDMSKTNIDMWT